MKMYVTYFDGVEDVFEGVVDYYTDVLSPEFLRIEMDDFSSALVKIEAIISVYFVPDEDDLADEDVVTDIVNKETSKAEYGYETD